MLLLSSLLLFVVLIVLMIVVLVQPPAPRMNDYEGADLIKIKRQIEDEAEQESIEELVPYKPQRLKNPGTRRI